VRPPEQRHRLLAREFLASALYLDVVLFAALVGTPESILPSDRDLVLLMFGTALGLVAAHWFAFRLAAHVTTEGGSLEAHASQEAAVQAAGGVAVALLASLPYLLTEGETAHRWSLLVLAALPAVTGVGIGRARGYSWAASAVAAAVALAGTGAVVILKIASGH
jgi:hypothetical protein